MEIVSTLEGRKQAYENCFEMIRDTVSVAQVERWDEKPHGKGGERCSQSVYRCRRCGKWDYGYPGGPGDRDCRQFCNLLEEGGDSQLSEPGAFVNPVWPFSPTTPHVEKAALEAGLSHMADYAKGGRLTAVQYAGPEEAVKEVAGQKYPEGKFDVPVDVICGLVQGVKAKSEGVRLVP